jgi:tripartite-type tricarboxylate transporter receptor subunit TctC
MKRFLTVFLTIFSLQVLAQSTKPIEIVVPFAPGGLASTLGLMTAEILSENNIPAIVVNRPGADGTIGANSVARANPDGRTLFLGTSSILGANLVFGVPGMEYTENSFAPVVPLAKTGMALITKGNSPIKNIDMLKFYVKANPDKFNIGVWNTNIGKIMQDWARREGLPAPQIVAYKGTSQLLTDVAGGHVLFGFDTWTTVIPLFRDQKLLVLGTLDNAVLAEVKKNQPKTEAVNLSRTHPDLEFGIWYGLFAPAGTNKTVLDTINATINAGFRQPRYQQKLQSMEIVDYGGTAESLLATQRRSIQILTRLRQEIK